MSTRSFIATRADLEPGILAAESRLQLKYVRTGWHDTALPEVFSSALNIPKFGYANYNYFTANDKYLVLDANSKVNVQAIPQVAGGTKYMIEFSNNEEGFWFQPGGVFDAKTIVGGSLAPNSTVPEIVKMYSTFARLVLKGFLKVRDDDLTTWNIGPEAEAIHRIGSKFVTDCLHGLRLPEH